MEQILPKYGKSESMLHGGKSPFAAYCTTAFLCFAVIVGYYLFDPFGFENPKRDSWHHIAVLGELIANPFDPSNPHIPTGEPSRYYSPLAVVAGILGKIFSLTVWQVYSALSVITCIGFVAGCWLFAKKYYQTAWAPLLLLLTLLFAWGEGKGHAGFHNFSTFFSSAAYPTTQALVLGIFCWYLALVALEHERLRASITAGLAAMTAVLFLTHQFSGVIMSAGTGSLILFHQTADIRTKFKLIAILAIAGLATFLWPYFNPFDVVFSAADPRWKSDVEETHQLGYVLAMMAPALAGIFGVRNLETKKIRWEIALPVLFFGGFYLISTLADMSIAHRVPPALMLYLHLGLVWLLLSLKPLFAKSKLFAILITIAGASLVISNIVTASSPRMKEIQKRDLYGRMMDSVKMMQSHVPEGSIAFASDLAVFPYQSTGRRVVSIPRPEPVAFSLPERQAATDRFFNEDTSQSERSGADWPSGSATHVVFNPEDLSPAVIKDLQQLGSTRRFPRDFEIITFTNAGETS